jgi:acetylornithine deacetylase/succinyl-diaminopimelate desuccinylase-like protein
LDAHPHQNALLNTCERHFPKHLEQLKELIEIPSVSFEPFPPSELERSAKAVAKMMTQAGLEHVDIFRVNGSHPAVVGDWLHAPGAPTLLLYAHHDVQPPMVESLWDSPPFSAEIRNGRLYGRGSADDKAGIIVHIASTMAHLKSTGSCPVNLRFFIEGEEEIGSPHLGDFLTQHLDRLKADAVLVVDLQNFSAGLPTLTNSLRGMVCAELELFSLEAPLHSGLWGGPTPDVSMGLCKLLSSLCDDQGQLSIPGITQGMLKPSEAELQSWQSLPMTEEIFAQQTQRLKGVESLAPQIPLLEKLWRRPSLCINVLESGSRRQAGNVIQSSAWARIGLRIPPGMDPERTERMLKEHLESQLPWGLNMKLHFETAVGGWASDAAHPFTKALMSALSEGYQREAVFAGCGATIPLAQPLSDALGGAPVFLIGIEDPESKAHAENESLLVSELDKAIKAQAIFFEKCAQIKNA